MSLRTTAAGRSALRTQYTAKPSVLSGLNPGGEASMLTLVSTQHPKALLDELYDLYRTALMNKLYYADRLRFLENCNLLYESFLAVGASTTIASWTIWQNNLYGKVFWSIFGGLVALMALLKPFLTISKRIEEYSKLYTGYNALYLSLDDIVTDVNISEAVNQGTKKAFDTAKERYNALAVTDVVHVNGKVLSRSQDEVNRLIPKSSLWDPALPVEQSNQSSNTM
jgi:hypothetical protein